MGIKYAGHSDDFVLIAEQQFAYYPFTLIKYHTTLFGT